MARYNKIFAGPVGMVAPASVERVLNADTAPGTIVTINGSDEFIPHAAQGIRGSLFILSENTLQAQSNLDADIPAGRTGIGFYPDEACFFHALVETGVNMVAETTLLTTNGTGQLEVAAAGDEVIAVAAETYNNNTGSDQLVLVRPYKGSVV